MADWKRNARCYARLACGCEHSITPAEYGAWIAGETVECKDHGEARITRLSAVSR